MCVCGVIFLTLSLSLSLSLFPPKPGRKNPTEKSETTSNKNLAGKKRRRRRKKMERREDRETSFGRWVWCEFLVFSLTHSLLSLFSLSLSLHTPYT